MSSKKPLTRNYHAATTTTKTMTTTTVILVHTYKHVTDKWHSILFDIAIFVLKRDVKLQPTNQPTNQVEPTNQPTNLMDGMSIILSDAVTYFSAQ